MVVLILVAAAVLVLFAADRLVKARVRGRWRQQMTTRLADATARADEQQRRRQAVVRASKAETSVMPAIKRPPLSPPGGPPHGSPKRRSSNEHTGPQARATTHPGGRVTRTGEHPARSADRA